jgi:outer membrane receptor protein involved in Fe transport
MKKFYTLLACLFAFSYGMYAQVGQGAIQGKIVDKETGEPLPFANVAVEIDGNPAGGSTTDFDGKYAIKPLSPGEYTVKASYVGYQNVQMNSVKVTSNQTTFLNLNMSSGEGINLETLVVTEFKEPLIEKDNNTTGGKLSREQFNRLPTRDVGSAVSIIPGTTTDGSGGTSIRGGRTGGNQTFIDGIKVRGGTNLPRAAIEEVEVVTGGIPAEVGDITGGATFVTTRGASTAKFGAVELVTSGFGYKDGNTQKTWGLDNSGYNLAGFTYGGPIWRKRDQETGAKKDAIVSFIFTSEFIHEVDPSPSIIGTYKLKDDKLAELKARPYMTPEEIGGSSGLSGSVLRSTYTVTENDMEIVETRQNNARRQINLQSNFTVNTSKNTTLRFGGTYYNQLADNYLGGSALYNSVNNPVFKATDWRVYGRFTQRFANPVDDEGNETKSTLRNAYVSIQADFQQTLRGSEHPDHGNDFFKYGYVGRFQSTYENSYTLGIWPGLGQAYIQDGFNQTNWDYTYSDLNPDLAGYTNQYYKLYKDKNGNPDVDGHYDNINNVQTFTVINGGNAPSVYGLWTGHGQYGTSQLGYDNLNQSQFRLTASGAADLKSHELKMGFEFEQRIDRGYSVDNPQALWNIGRQQMNFHLQQLDSSSARITYRNGVPYVDFDRWYRPDPEGGKLGLEQFVFDYRVRQALGMNPAGNEYIDFDSYDPTTFKIDYFSADDLINNNSSLGLSYYGYDYKGNKQSGSPTLDDFFNEKDEFGRYTRPIDAFRPIYSAGFIQDKFTFDDLIFRVGVRVDYFDANQPVLKDPYSLFPTITAGEINAAGFSTPSNIGSDYIVYVNENKSGLASLQNEEATIIGYRNPEDNTWYDENGAAVGRANDLTNGSGNPFPLLQRPNNTSTNQDLDASSFEDYKPQITASPRISFSFPISDEASFFANYDVLISRPTSGLQFRPTDYLFLGSSSLINNPNLNPEKTITYELGFKQALTKNTAITLSAFYREMRDQIQVFKFDGAYPVTYTSYSNIDFGTVSGFTLSYDLRRVKNIALIANYTLQFAQGTGSSSGSQFTLVNAGRPNLRNISPLDYDQRHSFNINFDYHYGYGKNYNGPKVKDKDIFSNAGFNITGRANSGRPFTKWSNVVQLGSGSRGSLEGDFNGSRLPWNFGVDARVDKRFKVELGSKAKDNRKFAWVEVYMQFLNLLNTQNVVGVYSATGNPDDDGYLTSSFAQPVIESAANSQSYVDHYQAAMFNPGFFSGQRRVRLGLIFEF